MNKLLTTCAALCASITPMIASAQDSSQQALSASEALSLAAEQDPSLKSVLIEKQRANLLIEQEQNRYVPMLSADAGYRAGQTAQPSPTGIAFITTQTFSTNTALQYTLPYGTNIGAAIRLERAVQDSVVLGNLGTVYGTTLSLDVSQPWLRGFGRAIGESGLRDAMYAHEIATLEEVARANAVASEVLNAYWSLWFLERQREVVEISLALQLEALELTRTRARVGVAAQADIARLEAEVAQAREEVLTTQGAIQARRLELSRQVGTLDEAQWSTQTQALPEVDLPDDRDVLTKSLLQSPEVKRLAQLVLRTRLQSMLASDQARPNLETVATLNMNGIGLTPGQAIVQLGTFQSIVGYVGMRISLPLVSRGLEVNAERAELGISRSKEELGLAQDRIKVQALTRYNDALLAKERVKLGEESVRAATISAEIEQARYKAGEGTSFEVTQALARQRQAELRVLGARRDALLASIELRRLMGTLVE